MVNDTTLISILINSGCLSYGIINSRLADRLHLPRIPCGPIRLQAVNQVTSNAITEAVCIKLDVGGRVTPKAYLYVLPKMKEYSMILGRPWLRLEHAVKDVEAGTLTFKDTGTVIYEEGTNEYNHRLVNAAAFLMHTQKKKQGRSTVFAVSIADINKALQVKRRTDPKEKLPNWIY